MYVSSFLLSKRISYKLHNSVLFIYTQLAQASRDGIPPTRALFYEYPTQPELFGVDQQWLMGDLVLVTPVMEVNTSAVQSYFLGNDRQCSWFVLCFTWSLCLCSADHTVMIGSRTGRSTRPAGWSHSRPRRALFPFSECIPLYIFIGIGF